MTTTLAGLAWLLVLRELSSGPWYGIRYTEHESSLQWWGRSNSRSNSIYSTEPMDRLPFRGVPRDFLARRAISLRSPCDLLAVSCCAILCHAVPSCAML